MGNVVNKPPDSVNNDTTIDIKNIIYDKNIKNYGDALRTSILKFKNTDINHLIGYPVNRSFTITSFEKYDKLYYYYTNKVFFDCDFIININVDTEGNEKIKMFIEIDNHIYDVNGSLRAFTLNKYGKHIKFIFCSERPIVNPFCVTYEAYVASKNYRYHLMTGKIIQENIEYNNGNVIHISPYTNAQVNSICRKFFE